MATPPNHERGSRPAEVREESLNWGGIVLGGCFVLAAAVVLVVGMPVVFMTIGAIGVERETDRLHAQLTAALVCLDVPPEALARIEAGLPSPNIRLRGARAVHSTRYPWLWVIAAEVDWLGYEGDDDFAAWRLETKNRDGASPAPDDSITAVTVVAERVSTFPPGISDDLFVESAISCTTAALGGA